VVLGTDRTDQVGTEFIFDLLTREYQTGKLREQLGEMLRAHQVLTTRRGRFTLYESARLTEADIATWPRGRQSVMQTGWLSGAWMLSTAP